MAALFSADEAESQLDTAIDWGRYAEIFAYDEDSGNLFLESEPAAGVDAAEV